MRSLCFLPDLRLEPISQFSGNMQGLELGVAGTNAIAAPTRGQGVRRGSNSGGRGLQSSASSNSSHVARMRQLSRGALARGGQVEPEKQLAPPPQNLIPLKGGSATSGGVGNVKPPTMIGGSQPPVTVLSQPVAGAGLALKNNSTSSFGSSTPSTSSADNPDAAAALAMAPSSVLHFQVHNGKPKSMKRATQWTPEVENLFRFQLAGYQDVQEYLEFQAAMYGHTEPQPIPTWEESGFIRSLQNKNSNYMYFRKTRECQDKFLNKVKQYYY